VAHNSSPVGERARTTPRDERPPQRARRANAAGDTYEDAVVGASKMARITHALAAMPILHPGLHSHCRIIGGGRVTLLAEGGGGDGGGWGRVGVWGAVVRTCRAHSGSAP